jgi:polysaccharide biosynthesis transport protein
MNLHQFLLILRAHYKIALTALIITVAVTIIVSMQLPKQYTAAASVFIDVKPDPIASLMMPAMSVAAPASYMATQVDVIKSDRVAQNVVKILKLDESPTARERLAGSAFTEKT